MLKEVYQLGENYVKFKANQFINAVHEQKRHFEASGNGRRTERWYRQSAGPAADANRGLRMLRGFSRDLTRNNPHAQRAITVIATNTVGSGIIPTFKGTRSKKIKELWGEWAGTKACDFYENMDFYGLQEQIMRAVAESGDAIVVRRWNFNNKMGFDLQVLESDFLDETKTLQTKDGFILQGVEFDRSGRRVGYWLFEEHPNEIGKLNSNVSRFVPKSEVIHVFEVLRPGQVRGVPMGVSAFIRIKDFDEFQDAQLHTQKVAACFVMTVTDARPLPDGMRGASREQELAEHFEPGQIFELPYGREAKFSQPPSVSGTDTYSMTVLRSIASGYNITYEAMTNDYSMVNFSSGRMGWLEFARSITSWQNKLMITKLCHGVYNWFEEGLTIMEGIKPRATATWTTPRREMIDPLKEGAAIIASIKAGIISRQEAIRQNGYDPDDVNAEIKEDMEIAETLGALFTTDVANRIMEQAAAKPKPSTATVKPQVTTVSKK